MSIFDVLSYLELFIMMKKHLLPILFLMIQFTYAQYEKPSLVVKKINEAILLDGNLEESIWEQANTGDSFWEFFPTDSLKAQDRTEVKLLYDNENLYVGIKSYTQGNQFNIGSLKRDFSGRTNDNTSILLDTYSDGNNAYMFGVNPAGVAREALVSNGGAMRGDYNMSWDTRWKAEAKTHDGYYSIEMVIPFNSIKFQQGATKWKFQCYRFDNQSNTQSIWSRVPQNMMLINLAFTGEIEFEEPLGKSTSPIELIPYINTISSRDFNVSEGSNSIAVGGDAKIAVGNNLNLDLTLNPDFSNVEVDDVITNLTRFEVSLPEKRQFFIDNSDLFGAFGSQRDARPFFSRRIGIATDKDGNTIENRILGGVRLSGKLNEDWRMGFLNIQTDKDVENEIAANNNAMFILQKKVFSRSNIGFFFLNRQTTGDYDFVPDSDVYNRVVGVDYKLASSDSKWQGNFFVHKSYDPDKKHNNTSSQAFLMFNTRNWRIGVDTGYIGEDFRSDLGFIPRTDVLKSGKFFNRLFYPKSKIINTITLGAWMFDFWKPSMDYKYTDYLRSLNLESSYKNQSELTLRFIHNFTYLTFDFEPSRTEGAIALPAGTSYKYRELLMEFSTNQANAFSIDTQNSVGEFYNGNKISTMVKFNYRMPPRVQLSLQVNYDQIKLPAPYSSANIVLVIPKADISFSKKLYWSTLMQYSNQQDNFGINSRLQWRYAPLSDIYLVYNDNYSVNIFEPKYRSINLKWSYRFPI